MIESPGLAHICTCLTHSLSLKPIGRWPASANLYWTDYSIQIFGKIGRQTVSISHHIFCPKVFVTSLVTADTLESK